MIGWRSAAPLREESIFPLTPINARPGRHGIGRRKAILLCQSPPGLTPDMAAHDFKLDLEISLFAVSRHQRPQTS